MKISKKVGKKLAKILKNDRKKREQIAKTLGIPADELVDILDGKRKMTEENLESISTSLDTPIEDFVTTGEKSKLVGKIMEKAEIKSSQESNNVMSKVIENIKE